MMGDEWESKHFLDKLIKEEWGTSFTQILSEMDEMSRVQIPDEADCFHLALMSRTYKR